MRTQELSLMMMFDAIMTEGSITRAAERLALTQPAVSNAVSRMRHVWKDELFIKDGRKIKPTLFAQNLWVKIQEPLRMLDSAIEPNDFDLSTSTRTFKVGLASAIADITFLKLRKLIEKEAPLVNIHAIPYTIGNGEKMLHDAEVDLVFGAGDTQNTVIHSEQVFNPIYVCIMRAGHPLANEELTIDNFADAEHLLVSLSGDVTGYTDQILAKMGKKRRIAMTVNHFSAVASLIANSNLIAVVPPTAVEDAIFNKDIIVKRTPIEVPAASLTCLWHKRQELDQGLNWLRTNMCQILKDQAHKHYKKLETIIR